MCRFTLLNDSVLRPLRLLANLDELVFRHSYSEEDVPARVMRQVDRF
jgi:hypothetical protein